MLARVDRRTDGIMMNNGIILTNRTDRMDQWKYETNGWMNSSRRARTDRRNDDEEQTDRGNKGKEPAGVGERTG